MSWMLIIEVCNQRIIHIYLDIHLWLPIIQNELRICHIHAYIIIIIILCRLTLCVCVFAKGVSDYF